MVDAFFGNIFMFHTTFLLGKNTYVECLLEVIPVLHLKPVGSTGYRVMGHSGPGI